MADGRQRLSTPPYVSRKTLAEALEISESTVDDMVRRGVLPKPVRLSPGCIRWRWETVDAALASRVPGADAGHADPYMQGVRDATEKDTPPRTR
jgi:predicted DNA-binding transcriptional regulator AlpA